MKAFVTECKKCQLKWFNTDKRDYTNDVCMVCRSKLDYLGEQEMKAQGVIQNPYIKTEIVFNAE